MSQNKKRLSVAPVSKGDLNLGNDTDSSNYDGTASCAVKERAECNSAGRAAPSSIPTPATDEGGETGSVDDGTERPDRRFKSIEDLGAELGSNDKNELSRDEIFKVLSNERRRLVLQYLNEEETEHTVDFSTLVDHVAARENETTVGMVDSRDRKCVYTALRQTHLPKLDDFGVVEYDNRRGTVSLTDAAQDVQAYMGYRPERDLSWSQLYLLLSGVCVGMVLLVWGEIGLFGTVSGLGIAMGIVAVFGMFALYHTTLDRQTVGWVDRGEM